MFIGIAVSTFYLTKNLRLTKHHRIKAATDTHKMPYGLTICMMKQIGIEALVSGFEIAVHPLHNRFNILIFHAAIEFSAVAGGYNSRLFYRTYFTKRFQGITQPAFANGSRFPYVYRSCVMVESEGKNGHSASLAKTALEPISKRIDLRTVGYNFTFGPVRSIKEEVKWVFMTPKLWQAKQCQL